MSVVVTDLRCEHNVEPIGVGTASPRLSWRLEATAGERDVVQQAWQVQVGSGDGVTWDSGRIDGRNQTLEYAGPALPSRAERWWRVRSWTTSGETDWSER